MKFLCLKDNLKEGLSIVEKIVDRNTALPILEYFLLNTEKGQLIITGTNLEIGIQSKVQGKVEEDGALTTPARILTQLISISHQEKVFLEGDSTHLTIKDEKTSSTLKSLDPEDYPLFPTFTPEGSFTLQVKDLREALEMVSFSLSGSDTRPELSGVFVDISSKEIVFAATDSFRLAEKRIPHSTNLSPFSFIIPTRTVQEIVRISTLRPQGELTAEFNKNQITFHHPNATLASRLVSHTFPDYQQIIPQGVKTELVVDRKEFQHALQLASVIAGKFKEVTLLFEGDQHFIVRAKNQELGEYESKVPLKKQRGDSLSISFNVSYLLDVFHTSTGPEIQLQFFGESRPGMVKFPSDAHYLYLIMPLRS